MQKRQFFTLAIATFFSILCWQYPSVLFNSLFVLWLAVVFHRRFRYTILPQSGRTWQMLSTGAAYLSVILSLFLLTQQFKRLVLGYSAVLDFENILNFSKQSLIPIISALILTLACFLFSHRMILGIFQIKLPRNLRLLTLLGTLVLALPLVSFFNLSMPSYQIVLIAFVYLLLFDLYIDSRTTSLTWLISWLVVFSAFTSLFIYKYNLERDLNVRVEYAKILADLHDTEAELALPGVLESIFTDDSLQSYFTTPIPFTFEEKSIRARIDILWNESAYLSEVYEYEAYVLNENFGHSFVEGQVTSNAFSLLKELNQETVNQVLFAPEKALSTVYAWRNHIPIPGDTTAFNTLLLGFKPKAVSNSFSENYKQLKNLKQYSFSVYYDNKFIWQQGLIMLDAQKTAIPKAGDHQEFFSNSTSNLIYNSTQNTTVIIAREVGGYYRPMTFFSFIFSLFIFAVILLSILNYFFKALSIKQEFPLFWGPSLRNKIQLYIIILLLVSFFAMGAVSNFSFRKSFNSTPANPTEITSEISSQKYDSTLFRFWENLLNVYVFLLLITAALSILITNRITNPLTQMMEKLKGTKLSKNEPLEWKSDDEIGQLVATYNKMIGELEESAAKLKQSEREGAWREMAKQVAHEIKNPLTPMKLHVQHLMRVYEADPEQGKILVKRVSKTLIEQIDSLTRIATEFSSFAQMPETQNTSFVLNDLLDSVFQLFKKEERGDSDTKIKLNHYDTDIFVFADREQLLRVFNNLLKNAIQSIPEEREGLINISLQQKLNTVIIKVSDNGNGIPEVMQARVFEPSFTTKNSGMGLGLAISKNIVESAGGRIYFETEVGVGTTFFVEVPVEQDEITKRPI